MSNENQETIADIVREMRTLGRLDEKSTDKIPRSLQALGLRTYADRIEAAAKREREAGEDAAQICGEIGEMIGRGATCNESVTNCNQLGNAAAMREALENVRSYLLLQYMRLHRENTEGGGYYERILDVVNSALSAPPRNCDIPLIVDEAADNVADKAWLAFRHCNPNVYFDVSGLLGCIDWLFDEAKGEANEQK